MWMTGARPNTTPVATLIRQREQQHLPVDADLGHARNAAGVGRDQQAQAAERQQHAESRARQARAERLRR